MAKIKTLKGKVIFHNVERELCKVCGFPDKFCKHTIEKQFKTLCPETPLDKESIWQLVRSHAIVTTEKRYHVDRLTDENTKLKHNNDQLMKENEELSIFRKQTKEILKEIKRDS